MNEVAIRPAGLNDLPAITEIYNEAILTTDATLDTEPVSLLHQEKWFRNHSENYPIFVLEQDQSSLGWGSLSKWSDRCGYAGTSEVSLYLKEQFRGKGLGKKLLKALIQEGSRLKHHCILSRISTSNTVSINLHLSHDFQQVGILKEVGRKFNKWVDVAIFQKLL